MKGYKAFHFDLKCRPLFGPPFAYEIGRTYEMKDSPKLCRRGFHFCREVSDVYNWYAPAFDTRVCEVEAGGTVIEDAGVAKCVTNYLTIVKELSPGEISTTLHDADPLRSSYIKNRLLDSLYDFYHRPERYLLWGSKLSTQYRKPSETEIPRLRERADEWWALLEPVRQERQA